MTESWDAAKFTETELIQPIPKVATHVRGLDEILEGGLPEGQITAVIGGPGSGKTVLGLEFAYRSALSGEPCIFASFEERATVIRRNALAMGWDLKPLEDAGKLFLMDSRPSLDMFRAGDYNLSGLLAILEGKAQAMGAMRLVIDSLDVILRIFEDGVKQRDQLYYLVDWMNEKAISSILTARSLGENDDLTSHRFLEFATDCLIKMDFRVSGQIATRRLRVVKYRGSSYGSNEYPCIISRNGIFLLPISTMGLQQTELGRPISSGQTDIDELLGGGYRRASSVLVAGSAGTGKTTLLSTFAQAACSRGEKVLFVNFEESMEAMTSAMLSVNIDLHPFIVDGTLKMLTALPESMGAEDHFFRAFRAIEEFRPDHVLVDAVSATLRIDSRQAAFEYLMRLMSTCKERGITSLLSNQVGRSASTIDQISGLGISSLVDAILQLRYVNHGPEIKRLFLVIKSRGMAHSNQYQEFTITNHGIGLVGTYIFPIRPAASAADIEGDLKSQPHGRREKE